MLLMFLILSRQVSIIKPPPEKLKKKVEVRFSMTGSFIDQVDSKEGWISNGRTKSLRREGEMGGLKNNPSQNMMRDLSRLFIAMDCIGRRRNLLKKGAKLRKVRILTSQNRLWWIDQVQPKRKKLLVIMDALYQTIGQKGINLFLKLDGTYPNNHLKFHKKREKKCKKKILAGLLDTS